MDCKGYNGAITVDSDALTIVHSGIVAKSGGLVTDQPRRIPLQAISSVVLKDATRLVNGWITLGVGGADAEALGASQAPSDPNSVMFRFKDREAFGELRDRLAAAIDTNRAAGIDPSTVEAGPAAPSRLNRMDARNEERNTAAVTAILGSGSRPDIEAAAARMTWRFGGKRELKNLASHLHDGETVRIIAQGSYEGNQGIVALTDARLLFLFHGIVGRAKEDFPLRLISSVQTKSGFGAGELKIFVSGNNAVISGVITSDLDPLADAVRAELAAQHSVVKSTAPSTPDPFEAMQKLAALRDAGILSDEEFEVKKKDLLDRM
ncbi:DUF4429 domain-containing protein [Microbacterium sp. F51-2R]|uniref:DUF4429 domain-containing protein n=1 Tax=Microbacterium sp. F51-2R TaxID=3445777 RepID=UPI003F9F1F91